MIESFFLILPNGQILSGHGPLVDPIIGKNILTSVSSPAIRDGAQELIDRHRRAGGQFARFSAAVEVTSAQAAVRMIESVAINRRSTDIRRYFNETVLPPFLAQAKTIDVNISMKVLTPDLHRLEIDPEKIGWIASAVIGNALRFVRHGSRNLPGGSIQIELDYNREDLNFGISVIDDGTGIPENRLPWLFQRAEDKPVFGLALKVAHEILSAQGGSIRAVNRQDGAQGAIFRIEVPASEI